MTEEVVQRAIGALLGSAVGDALGAPFEFQGPGRYRARFPAPVLGGAGELLGGGPWAPGEFTDDTQMAVALAASLQGRGGFDPADLWARWVAWAHDAKDVGIQTRKVLAASSFEGAAERIHRQTGRSAGNGSVMRNTPVALFTLRAPREEALAVAARQAALTHFDPHNGWGAGLHAVAVRAFVEGGDGFAAAGEVLAGFPEEARAAWGPLLAPGYRPVPGQPNGDVFTCLAQAFWAVRGAVDFEDAVVRAIELGQDADTVACVAGGLAGARFGVQGIPSRWATYVHGVVRTPDGARVRWGAAELQGLARALLGLAPPPLPPPDEPGGPTRLHPDLPLFAADLAGAHHAGADWAVISLCRTPPDFGRRPVRRQVFLLDQDGPAANPGLDRVVRDAVDTIDAFLAEAPARPVLVHCHAGRSRTALVWKAWAMSRFGWSEARAHDWLTASWPRADRRNAAFVAALRAQGG